MPELPEVETVRRMLESHVLGRRIRSVKLSGLGLRGGELPRTVPRRARGRSIEKLERHGKYLLIELSDGLTLLSHLGMSGRWLFHPEPPGRVPKHVHVRVAFDDGTELWFEDPRRFGMLRAVETSRRYDDPALAILGPDPLADPPTSESLAGAARGLKIAIKLFLLDQKRIAGVGNIYASEVLHRAGVDPRRRAGSLTPEEWTRIAAEIVAVLGEAVDRMGTTFSMYRTLWNEPGQYGERLLVYDRAGEPCRGCGGRVRRIVQGARSTYFCPNCQPRAKTGRNPHKTAGHSRKNRSRNPLPRRAKARTL
jgi:formamidopyrimidine-DNA glycosylase